MVKNRLILLGVTATLVVLLFYLPKVVVDDKDTTIEAAGDAGHANPMARKEQDMPSQNAGEDMANHMPQITKKDSLAFLALKEKRQSAEDKEKSAIFADSLASMYKRYQLLDSAAKYTELAGKDRETIGNSYYDAFSFAVDPEEANRLGEKARSYYEAIIKEHPNRYDLKTKVAMTYISTSNPMQGIMMLRGVLEDDPNNRDAIFNLGVLSIQSNQLNKAVERFQKLVKLDDNDVQAHFYLGLSYFQLGKKTLAREQFNKVKALNADPELQAAADSYLEKL